MFECCAIFERYCELKCENHWTQANFFGFFLVKSNDFDFGDGNSRFGSL